MPFGYGANEVGRGGLMDLRRAMTPARPSARGGHMTTGIPIGGFLGEPEGAQAHRFVSLRLPLAHVGRQDFHMY